MNVFVRHKKYVGQKYSPKNKYFFASFNNDRGLRLGDKTKDYVDRNAGSRVDSLHEVTQLGYKKTTSQLLEHIGLENMKVGLKTNFGRLTTISNLSDGC